MSWFKRDGGGYGHGPMGVSATAESRVRTEGLWIKCAGCKIPVWKADLLANINVCPRCQYHYRIGARQRIDLLLEPGYELVDGGLRSTDPLNFTDVKPYKQRLINAQSQTGLDDAILNAIGRLGPHSMLCSASWSTPSSAVPWAL